MANVSHIKIGDNTYDIKDNNAISGVKINGNTVTPSSGVVDLTQYGGYYSVCSTAAATAAKTVDCTGFVKQTGSMIAVKFTVTNSAAVADLTLDVNSTGASNIKYRNANLSSAGVLAANRFYIFVYDGTYWQIVGDLDTNSNNYDRTSVQTRIYTGALGAFAYALVGLDKDQKMQPFTTTGGTGTSKAFNTSAKFLYPPEIMYHYNSTACAANGVISNNVLYEQFPSVDLRYSCNITSSAGFTKYMPLYIECTFDSDGYWSITSTGLTQTFTSGKYYILLGCMYNTSIYQLALFACHPVFYYNGTSLVCVPYTMAEKTKLAGIAEGATAVSYTDNVGSSYVGKYKIGTITINGTANDVYGKSDDIKVETLDNTTVSSTSFFPTFSTYGYPEIPTPVSQLYSASAFEYDYTTSDSGNTCSLTIGKSTFKGNLILWDDSGHKTTIYQTSTLHTVDTTQILPGIGGTILNTGTTSYTPDTNAPTSETAGAYKIGDLTIAQITKSIYGKDTKNTAGSTDTSSKIYLIGATSQAANPQTYSDNEVYTTSGALTTKTVSVGGGNCTMQYNTTTQSLDFVFT